MPVVLATTGLGNVKSSSGSQVRKSDNSYEETMTMGSAWNDPRDKAPPIEEVVRHQKKGGGRKPFAIESRYIGKLNLLFMCKEWAIERRYKTEKQRDQALIHLQSKVDYGGYGIHLEYRKHEPDEQRE
jgi:hypothetical protein